MSKKQQEKEYYAMIRWSPEDIQTLRPKWSHDKCAEWLFNHQTRIQDRTIELGWEVIDCLLTEQ